jgi:hypothetical protein
MVNLDLAGAVWRKSSRTQGNGECVEISFPDAAWRTSIRSQGNGACVQVAVAPAVAGIRDSKNPDGGVLLAGFPAWEAFRLAAKRAQLDCPDRRPPVTVAT